MPRFRNALICLGALAVGAGLGFAVLHHSRRTPPVAASLPERREPTVPVPAPQVSLPSPTPEVVQRWLEAGTVHFYPLTVKAGTLLELIVDQKGVDLQVSILDPASTFTADSPIGPNGHERVLLVAKEAVFCRVKVAGRGPNEAGSYRIWIAADRRATERDFKEAEAERLFHQARESINSGDLRSPESKLLKTVRLWIETRNIERQADALHLLGKLYRERWQWQESLEARLQAKSLYHRARRIRDEGALANDIGFVYEQLANLDAARKSYEEALTLGERYRYRPVSAVALNNLGNLAQRRSRSGEALEYLQRARAIWEDLQDNQEIKALAAIGAVYVDAGRLELAIPKFKEALELVDDMKDFRQKAVALRQVGNALARQDPEQARRLYEQARQIQQQQEDLENLPATLNGLGLVLFYQERFEEAVEPFQKALRLYERKGNALDRARVLTNLGWTYVRVQREDDARAAFEGALVRARGKDGWVEAGARLGLARLEEQSRNPIAARSRAQAAVRAVEAIRQAVSRDDLQTSFLATKQDVYDALIEILLWQHELQPFAGFDARALAVSEQARSRGLLDDVSEPRIPMTEERSLSPIRILTLKEIQREILDPETLLLELHVGSKASYLWVVGHSFLRLFKLPPREDLETLAAEAHRSLARSGRREKLSDTWQKLAELSRVLLGPAAPWLGRKRLLISSPVSLQGIPFAVLPDPNTPDADASGGWCPLVLEHEIVKIPSASVLAALRAREASRAPAPYRLALLADPVFDLTDERLAGVALPASLNRFETGLESLLGRFKRLAHARLEAETILKETGRRGVHASLGFEANRDLVLSGRLGSFGILHFTTHGVLQTGDEELSALVLSLVDSRGRPRDGFLRASDIAGLDLPANLVVLSACETGLGKKVPGEGLVGLPQAFMAAGATRLLVSLWQVDDLASTKLMRRFYHEYLGRGRSPAAALREAQKAMWRSRRYSAPFYWAAFELQGDWRGEPPR